MKAIIKFYWNALIHNKKYVLNNGNRKIHYFTCKWCDNIGSIEMMNKKEAKKLILRGHVKMASCCSGRLKNVLK